MLPFVFACMFKITSKVDYYDKCYHLPILYILHNLEFRIPKFEVQISEFGIQNSELCSSVEMKSKPFGPSYILDSSACRDFNHEAFCSV